MSWYNLPRAQNLKSLFEFKILPVQNSPDVTSELIPLAPTWIYIEIVRNVYIVLLAQNYPTVMSELFPLGTKSDLLKNSTLHRNFSDGV